LIQLINSNLRLPACPCNDVLVYRSKRVIHKIYLSHQLNDIYLTFRKKPILDSVQIVSLRMLGSGKAVQALGKSRLVSHLRCNCAMRKRLLQTGSYAAGARVSRCYVNQIHHDKCKMQI